MNDAPPKAAPEAPAPGSSPAPNPAPIPVSVLTGFLGSGKTTLLSRLLADPALTNTAVIVNEFGEVGLDHLLLEHSGEDLIELDGGCLCCTVRGDLIDTLRRLLMRRERGEIARFERVIIETTGLADPAPILHTLMVDPQVTFGYRLDGVLTVAVADLLILSKTDLVTAAEMAALARRLGALNPAARQMTAAHGHVPVDGLFGRGLYNPETKAPDVSRWLKEEAYGDAAGDHRHDDHHHHDVNRHDSHIRAYCVTLDRPVSAAAFTFFLETLIDNRGPDLLRVKGIIHVAEEPDHPAVIHGVQHHFHPVVWLDGWPDDDHRTRIVFITRDIPKAWVQQFFDALESGEGNIDVGRVAPPMPAAG
jgi:G3E family GTPase